MRRRERPWRGRWSARTSTACRVRRLPTERNRPFRDWLTANPQLNVSIRRENEYYAGQSQTLSRLIRTIGFGIAGLMGVGAVFGAILTMYPAVATRAREIFAPRQGGDPGCVFDDDLLGDAHRAGAARGSSGDGLR